MIFLRDNVEVVRCWFRDLKAREEYVVDKSGCKTLEVIGATFIADEPAIFGKVNDYVQRELIWYNSMSLNVNDIPGNIPQIWKNVADPDGNINSNYGWCIFSDENFNQYEHVKEELSKRSTSRRSSMIYTRPKMWLDYDKNGMSDFMCTSDVQYLIRNNELIVDVRMRSQDLIFGYKNDFSWQKHVQEKLAKELNVGVGKMVWHVGSLHCYEKHFDLIK